MADNIQEENNDISIKQFQQLQRSSYSLGPKGSFLHSGSQSPSKFGQKKSLFQDLSRKPSQIENILEKQPSSTDKQQKAFKVHYIYEKLQDRLKLRRKDGDQNFRKMMQEFKQLDTFVDTRSEIQSMNLAFQKGFKSSLEVLKIRDKIQQLNKELKDTSTKYQMQFGEYDIIDEAAEPNTQNGIKGAKQAKELLRRSKKYLQTKSKNYKNLDSTQAITDSLKEYIQKHTQTVNQIELKDDANEFYSNLEYVFEQQKKLISLKEQHAEFERAKQEEKEKQLRELIKQAKYDMNGQNDKNVPNQGYFDEYHKRTQLAINKAIKESKRIYRQKLGLVSQKEKLFLDIQENIIEKNLDKPQDYIEQGTTNQSKSTSINNFGSNHGSQSSIPLIKPLNISNQATKVKNTPMLQSRSSTTTPLKSQFITQYPSNSQSSLTRLNINAPQQDGIKQQDKQRVYNSVSRFNQSSINQTYIPSGEIQEEKLDDSFEKNQPFYKKSDLVLQSDQEEQYQFSKVERKLNNLIFSPSVSGINNMNKNVSTLSTARDTEKLSLPLNLGATSDFVESRNQSLIIQSGNESDRNNIHQQTYYTTAYDRSNRGTKTEFAKSHHSTLSQNNFRKVKQEQSPIKNFRSSSNNAQERMKPTIKTVSTRALRYQIQTEQTPQNRQSLQQTPDNRKRSLGELSEQVSNMVKQMAERSPKGLDIRRLSNAFTPKSTRFSIERRNIFLTNIGSQQDTVKQFISTMKEAESVYKEEKLKLIEQLQEVKQQYKSTQEKYEDPKITSIREVEQNVEHKFKNFLRRNYKPKTMQIANY